LEWCLAASFLAFFYTYIRDFQQITLTATARFHRDNLYHNNQHDELQEEIQDGDEIA